MHHTLCVVGSISCFGHQRENRTRRMGVLQTPAFPLCYLVVERMEGIEPFVLCLEDSSSAIELHPHIWRLSTALDGMASGNRTQLLKIESLTS